MEKYSRELKSVNQTNRNSRNSVTLFIPRVMKQTLKTMSLKISLLVMMTMSRIMVALLVKESV